MTTKFTPVLKVKQRNLDKIEANLAKARARSEALKLEMAEVNKLILEKKFPKSGSASDIQIAIAEHNLLINEKRQVAEDLELNAKTISHFETQYKAAYIEFEKIKYLHDEEIKKYLKRLKTAEAKMLDEIATQRYFSQKAQN